MTPDPAAVEHFRRVLAERPPGTRHAVAFALVELQVADAARAHAAGDDPGPALARALAVSRALTELAEAGFAALSRPVGEVGDSPAHCPVACWPVLEQHPGRASSMSGYGWQ